MTLSQLSILFYLHELIFAMLVICFTSCSPSLLQIFICFSWHLYSKVYKLFIYIISFHKTRNLAKLFRLSSIPHVIKVIWFPSKSMIKSQCSFTFSQAMGFMISWWGPAWQWGILYYPPLKPTSTWNQTVISYIII